MNLPLAQLVVATSCLVLAGCNACKGIEKFDATKCRGRLGKRITLEWKPPALVFPEPDASGRTPEDADVEVYLARSINDMPERRIELEVTLVNYRADAVRVNLAEARLSYRGRDIAPAAPTGAIEIRPDRERRLELAFDIDDDATADYYLLTLRGVDYDTAGGRRPTNDLRFDVPVPGQGGGDVGS